MSSGNHISRPNSIKSWVKPVDDWTADQYAISKRPRLPILSGVRDFESEQLNQGTVHSFNLAIALRVVKRCARLLDFSN